MLQNGFVDFDKMMIACGYQKTELDEYSKDEAGVTINIALSINDKKLYKNEYCFDLDKVFQIDEHLYVPEQNMEDALNYSYDGTTASRIMYSDNNWTEKNALVAHAGGAVRESDKVGYYTNSNEALILNYNWGHRGFECDFYLTCDNKLACVHDWVQFGDCDGRAYSEKEWLASKTIGSPATNSRYTTMMIGDLLDEMIVNKDMYIVTDTKSTSCKFVCCGERVVHDYLFKTFI